jgi:hypothetical protein
VRVWQRGGGTSGCCYERLQDIEVVLNGATTLSYSGQPSHCAQVNFALPALALSAGNVALSTGSRAEYQVTLSMTASGSVSDYLPSVVGAITTAFANRASVAPERVTVSVASASVLISVAIYVPDQPTAEGIITVVSPVTTDASAATAFLTNVGGVNVTIIDINAPLAVVEVSDSVGVQGGDQHILLTILVVCLGAAGLLDAYQYAKMRSAMHLSDHFPAGKQDIECNALSGSVRCSKPAYNSGSTPRLDKAAILNAGV